MAELTALERIKAKAAAKKAAQIDSIDSHPEDVKIEKIGFTQEYDNIPEDTIDFCGKHMKQKKNGVCKICVMEEKHKAEMARRNAAILDGTEKWDKNTCFKKDRQTKKYVKRMMGLTGKAYRKLNIKARRREKNK